MHILVTGASGALGPAIIAELLRSPRVDRVAALLRPDAQRTPEERLAQLRPQVTAYLEEGAAEGGAADVLQGDRLYALAGDLQVADLPPGVTHVVHAAALTRLNAPLDELRETNVEGTRRLIEAARRLPTFEQFVHVSSHCVAGKSAGLVAETLQTESPEFVNRYEQSKWEAEQAVAQAQVPARIVRLTTCLGDESGRVPKPAGIHLAIQWLHRGLIPLAPGAADSPVDLISTQAAARLIARAVVTPTAGLEVCQVAAGQAAPRLQELLDSIVEIFRRQSVPWQRGQILPPAIVGVITFQEFRQSVQHTRDALFLEILDAVDTLFAPLTYPRTYDTSRAEALWGGPLPLVDWRTLVGRVVEQQIAAGGARRKHG